MLNGPTAVGVSVDVVTPVQLIVRTSPLMADVGVIVAIKRLLKRKLCGPIPQRYVNVNYFYVHAFADTLCTGLATIGTAPAKSVICSAKYCKASAT